MPSAQSPRRSAFGLRSGVGVGLPWLGAALMFLAFCVALHSWWSRRGMIAGEATVAENVASMNSKGDLLYTPRLRFRTSNGVLVLALSNRSSDEIEFPAGKVVPILYRAHDPQRALISTATRVYATAIWFAVAGVIVFDIGWILLRLRPR